MYLHAYDYTVGYVFCKYVPYYCPVRFAFIRTLLEEVVIPGVR